MIRNLEYVGSVYAPREDETNYHTGGSAALENNLCCLNHIGQVVADAEAYGCRRGSPTAKKATFAPQDFDRGGRRQQPVQIRRGRLSRTCMAEALARMHGACSRIFRLQCVRRRVLAKRSSLVGRLRPSARIASADRTRPRVVLKSGWQTQRLGWCVCQSELIDSSCGCLGDSSVVVVVAVVGVRRG
jgi:hypothetical protein